MRTRHVRRDQPAQPDAYGFREQLRLFDGGKMTAIGKEIQLRLTEERQELLTLLPLRILRIMVAHKHKSWHRTETKIADPHPYHC